MGIPAFDDSVSFNGLTCKRLGVGTWAWGDQLFWGYDFCGHYLCQMYHLVIVVNNVIISLGTILLKMEISKRHSMNV